MWLYENGNYFVLIEDDGTKYRFGSDTPKPVFPESIDLKITNRCSAGCPFCHENSSPDGEDALIDDVFNLLLGLPPGVEIAIGGGNPLEIPKPALRLLISRLKEWGLIPNLTVNARHLDQMGDIQPNALGISYVPNWIHHHLIKEFCKRAEFQTVIHLIAGVHTMYDLDKCFNDFDRILILGYKQVGRGASYFNKTVLENIKKMGRQIGGYLGQGPILAFDNLAITQLDIPRFFTTKSWDKMYMGDDGEFTMYVDMVKREYGVSSTSKNRFPLNCSIKDAFQNIRKGV